MLPLNDLNLTFAGWPYLALALLAGAVVSALFGGLWLPWLQRLAVLDQPNERSAHTLPTPRGGGVAVLAAILLGWVLLGSTLTSWRPLLFLLPACLLLMAISWIDDRRGLPALPRLGAQCVAAALGLAALPDGLVLQGLLPFWLDRVVALLGFVWFINLFNFMDGIDGISGVQAGCTALALALLGVVALSSLRGGFSLGQIAMLGVMAGACFGFLYWNWHPAQMFLGDVGSVPLGFLLGYWLLLGASMGLLLAALILPLYYLADSGITLVRRARQGEVLWQAHREHFYQRAAMADGNHAVVARAVLYTNIALLAVAMAATYASGWFALAAPLIVCGLLFWMHRRAESHVA